MRTLWRGAISFGLVSIPIRVYTATEEKTLKFNQLHEKDHGRIKYKRVCATDGEEVPYDEIVKGFEYEKDQYVVFTDEDFDKVQIESSQAIVIEKFVDAKDVDQIYLDSPYYVAPDGAVAEETFRVIQHAMQEKRKVALSRVVLSNRERLIALTCRDKGLMMMTLRTADEVRDSEDYFTDIKEEEPEQEMLELAERLIEQKSGKFDPSEFKDRYQEAVIEMVKAKVKGQEPVLAKAPERGKVINLMDALKRSLEDAKPPAESRPRKAAGKKTAASSGEAKKRRKAS
jgi:DNA end-binding protein Ku